MYYNDRMPSKMWTVLRILFFYFLCFSLFSLHKTLPAKIECYEDLYRLLEEVELMVRTWRKRCDHAYTAHLRADPQAAAAENYDQLRLGEDYGFSDYEIEDDDSGILLCYFVVYN